MSVLLTAGAPALLPVPTPGGLLSAPAVPSGVAGSPLYDYQQHMVERIEAAWRQHAAVMVQMPTGTGKTLVLAAVVRRHLARVGAGGAAGVWVVAHRRELVAQVRAMLKRHGLPVGPGGVQVHSIQWLSRHRAEVQGEPALVIVDEAHHALASTYETLLTSCPHALRLGLTATPCRLDGQGFAPLFEVLLTSWSIGRFMAEGRLCLYDYISLRPESEGQLAIDALTRRGPDGDYRPDDMSRRLDVRPALERLWQSVARYAPGRKGIVYAIDIAHAHHIADYYRAQGVAAEALSCHTPARLRRDTIGRFRRGALQVLVNVDLFGEGFDCPDTEFVQLARPTLSLAKYLQMVGRGLRTAPGKSHCVVLDNVGLYRRFGLPSAPRDWDALFAGTAPAGRPVVAPLRLMGMDGAPIDAPGADTEMTTILTHEEQAAQLHRTSDFRLTTGAGGRQGVADGAGRVVVPCRYRHVALTDDGMACCTGARGNQTWVDLLSGQAFRHRPWAVTCHGLPLSTDDGQTFYPRLRSPWLADGRGAIGRRTLELQVGAGVRWRTFWAGGGPTPRLLALEQKYGCARLYRDEAGGRYLQRHAGAIPEPWAGTDAPSALAAAAAAARPGAAQVLQAVERRRLRMGGPELRRWLAECGQSAAEDGSLFEISPSSWPAGAELPAGVPKEGAWWVDVRSRCCHFERPVAFRRGFVELLREGEWVFVRNIGRLAGVPLRAWDVVADDEVCIAADRLYLRQRPSEEFHIRRRSDDFSYFLVHAEAADVDLKITQRPGEGLRVAEVMSRLGMALRGDLRLDDVDPPAAP